MSTNPAPSLKALAENKEVQGVSKATTFRVDPNLIQFEEGFNLRDDTDELQLHIDRLYETMKAGAFVPPVDVSIVEGKIIARDGHCRTKAAKRLRDEMPEFTLECRQLRGSDQDAVLHMLGTGSGQKALTPLEQGRGFLRLTRMGLTPAQIAAKLGISRVTVDNNMTLAEAPSDVQAMVAAGEVSSTTARDAVKAGAAGVAALKEAVTKNRTSSDTAKKGKGKKAAAKKRVTAKTLRGTAADKKTRTSKKAAAATPAEETKAAAVEPVAPDSSQVTLTADKGTAAAVAKFLRDFAAEDAQLSGFAALIETALL